MFRESYLLLELKSSGPRTPPKFTNKHSSSSLPVSLIKKKTKDLHHLFIQCGFFDVVL